VLEKARFSLAFSVKGGCYADRHGSPPTNTRAPSVILKERAGEGNIDGANEEKML